MSESALTQTEKESLLSEREKAAYSLYMKLKQPPMAQSTQAQFFSLFLQGNSCEEIVRLNPNGFPLGAIVRARVENDWDLKLREHQNELMAKVRERVQQVTLETIDRVANELAASNKLTNDRIKRFLQSGDEKELDGLYIGGVKHLEKVVDLLQRLTGQDTKKSSSTVDVRHTIADETVKTIETVAVPSTKMSPQAAADALAAIRKKRQQ